MILDRRLLSRLVTTSARVFGVERRDILGSSRVDEVCRARWAVWTELVDRGFSLASIGRAFDRDHTTIRSAVRRVRQLRKVDSPRLVLIDLARAEMARWTPPEDRDLVRVGGRDFPIVWTGEVGDDGAKIWRPIVRA